MLSEKEAKETIAKLDVLEEQIKNGTFAGDKDKIIVNLIGFVRNMLAVVKRGR